MTTDSVTTRLSSRGQVVIPKSVRDHLGLRDGDELVVEETADAIILRVKRRRSPARCDLADVIRDVSARAAALPPMTPTQLDAALRDSFGAREHTPPAKGGKGRA
jgi:AbrB family looped-hinge helix DNA binding protein